MFTPEQAAELIRSCGKGDIRFKHMASFENYEIAAILNAAIAQQQDVVKQGEQEPVMELTPVGWDYCENVTSEQVEKFQIGDTLYTTPPTAGAIRAAALRKAAGDCRMEAAASSLGHSNKARWQAEVAGRCADKILSLIDQQDDAELDAMLRRAIDLTKRSAFASSGENWDGTVPEISFADISAIVERVKKGE